MKAGQPAGAWGLALLAGWRGDKAEQERLLRQVVVSSPERIPVARILSPANLALASLARETHPDQPLAIFWVAEIEASAGDRPAAIEAYKQALALTPKDGVRWVELGYLYRDNAQPDLALSALERACQLRDRGGNGCWQAGLLAESLGQTAEARRFYNETLDQIPNYQPALDHLKALP